MHFRNNPLTQTAAFILGHERGRWSPTYVIDPCVFLKEWYISTSTTFTTKKKWIQDLVIDRHISQCKVWAVFEKLLMWGFFLLICITFAKYTYWTNDNYFCFCFMVMNFCKAYNLYPFSQPCRHHIHCMYLY